MGDGGFSEEDLVMFEAVSEVHFSPLTFHLAYYCLRLDNHSQIASAGQQLVIRTIKNPTHVCVIYPYIL